MPHASVEFCAWIVLSHEYNSEACTQSRDQRSCPRAVAPAAGKKQLCQLAKFCSYDCMSWGPAAGS